MRRLHLVIPILIVATVSVACGSPAPRSAPDVAGVSSSEARTPKDDDDKGDKKERNRPEPEWTGPNFEVTTFEGDSFELAAQAGHPVVLNFWESW